MPTNGTLGSPRAELFGIVLDFAQKLGNGTITPLQAKRFLRKEDPFTIPMDVASQLKRWKKLYKQCFNIVLDTNSRVIPERQEDFDRLIAVAQGVTVNQVLAFLGAHFAIDISSIKGLVLKDGHYEESTTQVDLDTWITENERTNKDTYVIRVRESAEADEANADKSADAIGEAKIPTMTLLERLLYELVYFTETGKHLDTDTATLCSSFRRSDDFAVNVRWCDDVLELRRVYLYASSKTLRARTVVSLLAEASDPAA